MPRGIPADLLNERKGGTAMFRTIINRIFRHRPAESPDPQPQSAPSEQISDKRMQPREFTQNDVEYARGNIVRTVQDYGYAPNGEAMTQCMADLEREAALLLGVMLAWDEHLDARSKLSSIGYRVNPGDSKNVRADSNEPGCIELCVRPSSVGDERFEAVVRTWFGDRINDVTKVVVRSNETLFFDASGRPTANFAGTGRKMYYESTFRADNASKTLALLGIKMAVDELAIRDVDVTGVLPTPDYPWIVFERQSDGSWTRHE